MTPHPTSLRSATFSRKGRREGDQLVEWAEIIFVMERGHRTRLQKRFRKSLKSARVVCLDFVSLRLDRGPDDYGFMQPELAALLEKKVGPFLK